MIIDNVQTHSTKYQKNFLKYQTHFNKNSGKIFKQQNILCFDLTIFIFSLKLGRILTEIQSCYRTEYKTYLSQNNLISSKMCLNSSQKCLTLSGGGVQKDFLILGLPPGAILDFPPPPLPQAVRWYQKLGLG